MEAFIVLLFRSSCQDRVETLQTDAEIAQRLRGPQCSVGQGSRFEYFRRHREQCRASASSLGM